MIERRKQRARSAELRRLAARTGDHDRRAERERFRVRLGSRAHNADDRAGNRGNRLRARVRLVDFYSVIVTHDAAQFTRSRGPARSRRCHALFGSRTPKKKRRKHELSTK